MTADPNASLPRTQTAIRIHRGEQPLSDRPALPPLEPGWVRRSIELTDAGENRVAVAATDSPLHRREDAAP